MEIRIVKFIIEGMEKKNVKNIRNGVIHGTWYLWGRTFRVERDIVVSEERSVNLGA